MNVSDLLADLYTTRQLLLQRLAAGELVKVNKLLDAVAKELTAKLRSNKPLTEYQGKRLEQQIQQLKKIVKLTPMQFEELASVEASWAIRTFASVDIEATLPAASTLKRIAQTALIQGASIGQWFSQLESQLQFDIERTIKNGVVLGQTNDQIAKALVGNGSDKGPEPFARSRRDVKAIVRTGVQTIANETRLATYEENADIIKALQWVSTLDSRTSDICMARAGKTWAFPSLKPIGHDIPWNGGPPAHWACRSTVLPITKTFAEIDGVDAVSPDITPKTRSSMDGQVAADLTFDDFLKGKPQSFADEMLGKGRAQLWREGKITLSELLSAKGTPLTLTQLKAKYG